jgi:phosphoribosylformimino-5-aminoimidazole carboxamide ribonucleotide (ProFAR) isomerase
MFQTPGPIRKVIIAGGVSSLEDLHFIWGFPKAVPQLGSAIWKQKLQLAEILFEVVRFNEQGLVPAIVSS